MNSNESNGSCALLARGVMALAAMLVLFMGLMARPVEAAPFAYVTNYGSGNAAGTLSVIDTATNMVVATVTVGTSPTAVGPSPRMGNTPTSPIPVVPWASLALSR